MNKTQALEEKITKAEDAAIALQARLVKLGDDIKRAIRGGSPELSKLKAERVRAQNELADLREQIGAFEEALPQARKDDARPAYVEAVAELDAATEAQAAAFARVPELQAIAKKISDEMESTTKRMREARAVARQHGRECSERPSARFARLDTSSYAKLNDAVRAIGNIASDSQRLEVQVDEENPVPRLARRTVGERTAARA